MKMTTTEATTAVNGVNIEALLGARQALTDAPPAAAFIWKGQCEWKSGTHSQTTIDGFFGLGEEQSRAKGGFTYDTDHPEHFASEDHGATPTEVVLAGLAGCLTAGVATVAANRGVTLNSVKATIEGDMDLQGIMGIDSDVRNGFSTIRVNYDIDADASDDEIRALVAQSQKRSAVFDALTNPTNVVVTVS
jgi:uncharacterized OsmC-like protein